MLSIVTFPNGVSVLSYVNKMECIAYIKPTLTLLK